MKLLASILLAAVCVGCIARIVVVDLAERRIPRQLCWAIAASGALLQLMVNGTSSVLQGALYGVVVVVVCSIVSALLGKNSIGGGDVRCMAALSLATGWGAPVGFLACFAVATPWALVQRFRLRDRVNKGRELRERTNSGLKLRERGYFKGKTHGCTDGRHEANISVSTNDETRAYVSGKGEKECISTRSKMHAHANEKGEGTFAFAPFLAIWLSAGLLASVL